MPDAEGPVRVILNPDEKRYELWSGDRLDGFASFRERPGAIDVFHTLIEPELEGHGLGGRLVAGVLDDARARGLRVVPTCSFVGYYVGR
ncbi:MAG TPA: GNAT family N-acetyltransferase, partial [Acidimicrobiales bacterium]|nr:GNAT family N-acetyltransferase [Acidimicrobiales bacterium]